MICIGLDCPVVMGLLGMGQHRTSRFRKKRWSTVPPGHLALAGLLANVVGEYGVVLLHCRASE